MNKSSKTVLVGQILKLFKLLFQNLSNRDFLAQLAYKLYRYEQFWKLTYSSGVSMLSAWMVCIFLRLFHRFVVVSKIGDVAEVQSWHNQSRIRKNLHFKGFFSKRYLSKVWRRRFGLSILYSTFYMRESGRRRELSVYGYLMNKDARYICSRSIQ